MIDASASELLGMLHKGEVAALDLTRACLDRIAALDGRVGAFLSLRREAALEAAADVDRRRRAGDALGALAGLPVAVKDIICVAGEKTTCASRMLRDFQSPYEATLVRRLKQADAIILGKTNLDEFAMGSSTENSALGTTRNPWDPQRVPGGSSGGAAACVAAGMVPLSIGTDTGGSIRQPASFCGTVGLKPTYGRVSRYGLIAFASSLDQAGPLARSVEDAALLLETIAGHDPRDSTSVPAAIGPWSEATRQPLGSVRLGVVPEHFGPGLDPEVAAAVRGAIDVYRSLGATVREVDLPHSRYAIATYYIIAPCEASSNLARYDGVHFGFRASDGVTVTEPAADRPRETRGDDAAAAREVDSPLVHMYRRTRALGFGSEVKRRIMLGTYALSAGYYDAYYKRALQVRRLIRDDYYRAFQQVDCLIGPVTPTAAFAFGEKTGNPLSMYLGDLYTVGANLAGIPGISLPCGFTRAGLPIGLQLQAPALAEECLLRVAAAFQRATDWHTRRPAL
jgi:aspartyl-tRNA(Asn)/glutamyl-tRNA(Gln) amidotransferase subunit A